MQILNSLNITAPELEDKANMSEFLSKLFEVSDTVELLEIPDIKQTIQAASQIVSKYVEQMQGKVETSATPQQVQMPVNTELAEFTDVTAGTMTGNDEVKPENKSVLPNHGINVKASAETETQIQTTAGGDKTAAVETPIDVKATTPDNGGSKKEGGEQKFLNQADDHTAMNAMQTQTVVTEKAQFTQAVTRAVASQNINTQDVVDQIINRMKVEIRGNVSEVRLTLRPENLGDVSLRIATDNGIVTAHFVAENQRIKEIIESNFNNLKDVLQEQGIEVSSLSVSVGGNSQEQRMQQFLQGQSQAMARANRIQGDGESTEDDSTQAVDVDTNEVYESSVDFSA